MTHGSLFSGIGGFDLAAEWMGWENVFHCEWNPFGQKILKHYWPNAISYTDITKTDFSIHRGNIDIITGGFPCQPFSTAGKRKGKEDNRYLWPEMLRAIREVQPTWIVAENVYGIINQGRGMVFQEVCAQMEDEGYQVQPYILPACAVNAPHRRDRFWFVANSEGLRRNREKELENDQGQGGKWRGCHLDNSGEVSDKNWNTIASNTNSDGYSNQPGEDNSKEGENKSNGDQRKRVWLQPERADVKGDASNSERIRQSRQGWTERQSRSKAYRNWKASWTYTDDRWPTQPPIRRGDDGLSSKLSKECLTGLGNAIVPQIAFEIFKAIESYELSIRNKSTSL